MSWATALLYPFLCVCVFGCSEVFIVSIGSFRGFLYRCLCVSWCAQSGFCGSALWWINAWSGQSGCAWPLLLLSVHVDGCSVSCSRLSQIFKSGSSGRPELSDYVFRFSYSSSFCGKRLVLSRASDQWLWFVVVAHI